MKYTNWVAQVIRALERATGSAYGGAGLPAVASELGVDGLTLDDFVKRAGLPHALITAMEDLASIGLVDFVNVGHGNQLTSSGRDVAAAGLSSVWPEVADILTTEVERGFLARLYAGSLNGDERSADLAFVDADEVCDTLGIGAGEGGRTSIQRMTFLGDLERKGFVKPETQALGSANRYRPTYPLAPWAQSRLRPYLWGNRPRTTAIKWCLRAR